MKHYVVTGGAGFIGSHLVRKLLQEDCRITCIDNFDPFYPAELKHLNIRDFEDNKRFTLHIKDLGSTSSRDLGMLIKEPVDMIIHLAAKAGVRPSIIHPVAYQQSNIIGLQHLVDFAVANHVKTFLFASSSSVYGVNKNIPWKEDEPLMPISPYAMTKLAGEMLGHVYSKIAGIRFLALRFFTVYGPGQRPDLAIHKFTKALLTGQPLTMYGDGSSRRDYTYVDDIVEGILAAMQYNRSSFEIINLGNHHTVSLAELIRLLEETTGEKAVIKKMPEQTGDVPVTFADIRKAEQLLGYSPKSTINKGLQEFYKWFLSNRDLLLK